MDDKINHLAKSAMIGEIKPDGQFNVIWKSQGLIAPQPFFSLDATAKK
jgi:urea transport system substrate-binding protein